jgi:hypothetical protein
LTQVTSAGISPALAGLFLSPISLYIALVLALNGAGTLVWVLDNKWFVAWQFPTRLLADAGVPSTTQQQLWAVLKQQPLPIGSSAGAIRAAEARLNANIAALQRSLNIKPGNGTELVIANALWTKDVKLLPAYQTSMQTLFQVWHSMREDMGCAGRQRCSCCACCAMRCSCMPSQRAVSWSTQDGLAPVPT